MLLFVVLGRHLGLDLPVVHDDGPEAPLLLRGLEAGADRLDLLEHGVPLLEVVAEATQHRGGADLPERLVLEPAGHVDLHALHLRREHTDNDNEKGILVTISLGLWRP